LVAVVKD
jgi:hypothetical protein